MKYKELEQAVIQKYSDAKEIYLLQRNRRMNKKEHIIDFLVTMFTPASGIIEPADLLSDLGTYFLVVREKTYLLVRGEKQELAEQDITKLDGSFDEKKFVVEKNQFKKVKKVYG